VQGDNDRDHPERGGRRLAAPGPLAGDNGHVHEAMTGPANPAADGGEGGR
jgi:hypothetical protein